jgi:hypothetical protein
MNIFEGRVSPVCWGSTRPLSLVPQRGGRKSVGDRQTAASRRTTPQLKSFSSRPGPLAQVRQRALSPFAAVPFHLDGTFLIFVARQKEVTSRAKRRTARAAISTFGSARAQSKAP